MSDHDNFDVRDLLDSASPGQPLVGAAERARAVAARGRAVRRRNRLALVAAAAVAAVGVSVPVLAGGDDGGRGVDVAAPTTVEPEACPEPPADVETLEPTDLPDGAAWARMCQGTWSGGAVVDSSTWTLTWDSAPITEGVDTLLGAIRDLPTYDQLEPECASMMMMPTPWTLVVGYPDGTTATIGSTVTACGAAQVADSPRSSAAILELVSDAGNDAEDDAATDGAAACPEPAAGLRTLEPEPDTYAGAFPDFRQTAAVVCYGPDPMGAPEYRATEGVLADDPRFTIVSDAGSRSTPRPSSEGTCTDSGPTRLIVLVDDEGRRLTLTDSSCTGEFAWAYGYWKPSPQVEQVITDALGGRVTPG